MHCFLQFPWVREVLGSSGRLVRFISTDPGSSSSSINHGAELWPKNVREGFVPSRFRRENHKSQPEKALNGALK